MHYNCGYDFEAEEFARRGYNPYPVREKSKEDLILEKLDAIVNLLNEQNLINQEIGKFMEATRKISDNTEMRISNLENKVNELEISNGDIETGNNRRDCRLTTLEANGRDKGYLINILGMHFNEDGSITWK